MTRRYWVETLGCPKNQVDSDKLTGTLVADGMERALSPEDADLVVVNTCAFIEAARQESIETVLALSGARAPGALVGRRAEQGDRLVDRGLGIEDHRGRLHRRHSHRGHDRSLP